MDCTSPVFGQFPCGKCLNCRARSRQEWIFRLRMEYRDCNFGLFVTLTYDDAKLPPDGVSVRDVQLFLKRLRKRFNSRSLRYFIVSEYGDHTFRPHYHGLLFFNNVQRSPNIYDIIENSWQNGFVQFGEIEEGSITYCTKYCLKGGEVPKGKNDNFRLLSKMHGGVGISHLIENEEFYFQRIDKPQFVSKGEFTSPMPRYYRNRLLKKLDPEDKEEIKILYSLQVESLREKRNNKLLAIFRKQNPGVDPDFVEFKKSKFELWLLERQERKAEAINYRTKKQNLL